MRHHSLRSSGDRTTPWCKGGLQSRCNPAAMGAAILGRDVHEEAIGHAGAGAMRARYPDTDGFVERDGVKVFYEVFGSGEPTILLLPAWSIVHSRIWKMQVPDLARRYRVVTFDPRGNGHSDRPASADGYAETEYAADAQAVMDATATERAILVSLSMGAQR